MQNCHEAMPGAWDGALLVEQQGGRVLQPPQRDPHPPPTAASQRDLCGTRAIDVLCAWGQLNGSSVISLSRG